MKCVINGIGYDAMKARYLKFSPLQKIEDFSMHYAIRRLKHCTRQCCRLALSDDGFEAGLNAFRHQLLIKLDFRQKCEYLFYVD
jgi:hypothetical protein